MLINGDHCNLFRVKASLIRQSINSYTFLIYWQLVLFAYLAFFLFKRLLFTYRYCIYNLYYMYIQYILSAFLFIYHMGLKTGFQSTSFFFSADASIYIAIFDYFVMMFFFLLLSVTYCCCYISNVIVHLHENFCITVYRKIFDPVYFRPPPFRPYCQWVNLRLGEFKVLILSLIQYNCVWANSRWGEIVCKCRGVKKETCVQYLY